MLKTKYILAPIEKDDGMRISIMSRHTLNDGKTPHPDITSKIFHLWYKQFAPPDKLIGDYYLRNLPWKEFEKKYFEYLRQPKIIKEVKKLAKDSLERNITVMCIEKKPDFCHRRLLAEECQRYESNLEVLIR